MSSSKTQICKKIPIAQSSSNCSLTCGLSPTRPPWSDLHHQSIALLLETFPPALMHMHVPPCVDFSNKSNFPICSLLWHVCPHHLLCHALLWLPLAHASMCCLFCSRSNFFDLLCCLASEPSLSCSYFASEQVPKALLLALPPLTTMHRCCTVRSNPCKSDFLICQCDSKPFHVLFSFRWCVF